MTPADASPSEDGHADPQLNGSANGAAAPSSNGSADAPRPQRRPVVFDSIPVELRERPQWVLWNYELNKKGKWTKVPYQPSGRKASSTSSRTWSTFERVHAEYLKGGFDGVGYVFAPDDPYCGLDLDGCRNPATGVFDPWAQDVLDRVTTYAEVSPSDNGGKAIGKAKLPADHWNEVDIPVPAKYGKVQQVELHEKSRYFAITGRIIPGAPTTCEPFQEGVDYIHEKFKHLHKRFRKKSNAESNGVGDLHGVDVIPAGELAFCFPPPGAAEQQDDKQDVELTSVEMSSFVPTDQEIVAKITRSRSGAKTLEILNGGLGNHKSQSQADLALCNSLAFWTKSLPDAAGIIHRIIKAHGIYREKWDRDDYRTTTIEMALHACEDSYVWKKKKPRKGKQSRKPSAAVATSPDDGAAAEVEIVPLERDDDPHRLSRVVMTERFTRSEEQTLAYWAEEFYEHSYGAYSSLPKSEMNATLAPVLKAEFDRANVEALNSDDLDPHLPPPQCIRVTTSLVANVSLALSGLVMMKGGERPPVWRGVAPHGWPANEILATPSQLIHLPSFADGKATFSIPATPRFFSTTALDYEVDPEWCEPIRWIDFLHDVWPNDPAAIDLLQEWCGYCLLPDTRQQKILLLVGPKRSGKGTIARILTRMIGETNVCGPTLGSFAGDFGFAPLFGRTLAIVSDARIAGRADTSIITERLLAVSGEDKVSLNRKYLPQIETKLNTRIMLLTNELPRLKDASGALPSRLLTLVMANSFYGKENHFLTEELYGEVPQMMLWAVHGWKRLRDRGRFLEPATSAEAAREMEALSSPISVFVRDCCKIDPNGSEFVRDLFAEWSTWCGRQNIEKNEVSEFGRDLRACVPGLRVTQPRIAGGERVRKYHGIHLLGRQELIDLEGNDDV